MTHVLDRMQTVERLSILEKRTAMLEKAHEKYIMTNQDITEFHTSILQCLDVELHLSEQVRSATFVLLCII